MRENPYEQGDELSRNDNWGLIEGLVEEELFDENKTIKYYYVRTFQNDLVLCKTLNPFAGNGYGAVYPFYKNDHVVIGFINGNPNCQAYILGGAHDRSRKMPVPETGESVNDVRVFVPKDQKIIERSNNKTVIVNKTSPTSSDGDYLLQTERDSTFNSGRGIGIHSGMNADGTQNTNNSSIEMDNPTDPGIDIYSSTNVDISARRDIILEGNVFLGPTGNYAYIPNGTAIASLMDIIKGLLTGLGATIPPTWDALVIDLQNANCGVKVKVTT